MRDVYNREKKNLLLGSGIQEALKQVDEKEGARPGIATRVR